MLSRQDSGLKRCWSVAVEHGQTTLREDWALVVLRFDEVNRYPRFRVPGCQNGFVHVNAVLALPTVLRQQRRMNVEDAVSKAPECSRSKLSHVSKQQHDIDVVAEEHCADCLVAYRFVLVRGSSDPYAGDAARTSEFQYCGVAVVADDDCRFRRQTTLCVRPYNVLNIRPTVRRQHAEP